MVNQCKTDTKLCLKYLSMTITTDKDILIAHQVQSVPVSTESSLWLDFTFDFNYGKLNTVIMNTFNGSVKYNCGAIVADLSLIHI